jgi:SAM-dependent methyltransferase
MGSDTANLITDQGIPVAHRRPSSAFIGLTFTLAVFLSAALLFIIEPMFGKMVLPLLGGSPAVWTTCMLFFQGALLLGYLYAHLGPRWLGLRGHTLLHICLLTLCLLTLPISVASSAGAFRFEHPNAWLLWVLTISLGAPFALLSSTGPLLQVWFSKTDHPEAASPYFLYAASNVGSMLALLSYPFLLEPLIPLGDQSRLWSVGYVLLIVLVAISAAYLRTGFRRENSSPTVAEAAPPVARGKMLRWTLLAFVPSSFFLALTTHLTTDVAAVPLLWVVPLVLYLLSFTMVFGRRSILPHTMLLRWQPVGLILLAVVDFWGPSASAPWLLPFHLIVFFITALVCHGELARTKPPVARLTDFYLALAIGGVLGGVFNALVAPTFFDSILEYPITLLLACAVRPRILEQQPSSRRQYWDAALIGFGCAILLITRLGVGDRPVVAAVLAASGVAAIICLRMSLDPLKFTFAVAGVLLAGYVVRETRPGVLLQERNFFGVREVRENAQRRVRELLHGTTKHGAQSTDPARRREPASYYYRGGPLGDFFGEAPSRAGRKVAVIGLGAGGLAAYGRAGEEWTFYEIDPDIARLARDTSYFTYLGDTPARVNVVIGDGRLSMLKAPEQYYDLIVLDAFTSDAIPLHLLTLEALSVYLSRLAPKGVLLFHLSNRYLDLEPVVARTIESKKLFGLIRVNANLPQKDVDSGGNPSVWATAARQQPQLGALGGDSNWRALRTQKDVALWTDDFSNIFKVFHLSKVVPAKDKGEATNFPDSAASDRTTN